MLRLGAKVANVLVSHSRDLTKIIRSLRNDRFDIVTITPQQANELSGLEVEATPLREYAKGLENAAFKWAAECVRALPEVTGRLNNNYPGLSLIKKFGDPFYYPRLADLGVAILALDKAKPDLVVLHNDVEPTNRAMALWARERDVPCLHIPHAVYQMINRTPLGTDVHDIVTATHLAVAGPFQREWYEQCGAENITETGLPQFDHWANREPGDKRVAMKQLGLDPDGPPVVVYCSTWGQNTNLLGVSNEWQQSYMAFLETCLNLPDIQPVVKCHPRGGEQNWAWHAGQAKEAGVTATITPAHLETVIDAADLFLAYGGSNVLLEAAHRPGLRLMSTHGYEGEKAVIHCPMDPQDMAVTIAQTLAKKPKATDGLLERFCGPCDGHNTERVIELCHRLLGG